ncbi:carbon-nitrogen hydrolase family protein [Marinicrinis lubricantis]|uniref:Carbon-nitrogen hydrolase family protein n=1 Tax=Marinicrinis lubricantis TaxID=2086470 RepID=A0ABW1IVU5_9BACL
MKQQSALKIALIQMRSEKADIDHNLSSMRKYISESSANGADFICFPEMNITGYIDPAKYTDAIISIDHPAVSEVVKLSDIYSSCVISGFVEHNPGGKPYINQFVAYNGKLLGSYRKKTIKDDEEKWFSPGDQQPIFTVSGLTFGLSVCADIDDPKIFAEYAQKGATIVFESAAPGLYGEQETRNWYSGFHWWRSNCMDKLGKYAADHSLYIGVATQAGRTIDEDFPGGGYLFDPLGRCTAETRDWSEGILYSSITI